MLCISRITDERIAQKFGDGKHNFHIEMRCNLPCMPKSDICAKCINKSSTYKTHGSRRFDQGKVNEPIPDHSHIFGGKWYQTRVKDWGAPPSEIIKFALQYQAEARQGYIVVDPDYSDLDKQNEEIKKQTNIKDTQYQAKQHKVDNQKKEVVSVMPRGKAKPKVALSPKDESEKTSINIRDITIVGDDNAPISNIITISEKDNNEVKPIVKRRRPTVATTAIVTKNIEKEINTEITINTKEEKKSCGVTRKKGHGLVESTAVDEIVKKEVKSVAKKRSPKKQAPAIAATESITNPLLVDQPILFQEAVIPTILEQDIEQLDTDGYEIEYITLREFELNNTSYYIESNKGKLYKKVKGGIGPYIGRYHKELEEIDTSVPDSDNEL